MYLQLRSGSDWGLPLAGSLTRSHWPRLQEDAARRQINTVSLHIVLSFVDQNLVNYPRMTMQYDAVSGGFREQYLLPNNAFYCMIMEDMHRLGTVIQDSIPRVR